ncbi:hypothetical protein Gpo141_00001210 [Globisporangium polare]
METCEICFETIGASDNAPTITRNEVGFVKGQLCGPTCPANICRLCLVAHLQSILDDCYNGVLPRMRCPICLTRLSKTQYEKYLTPDQQATHAFWDKYAAFCRKACSFQSPCCHKVDYTHLPASVLSEGDVAIDCMNESAYIGHLKETDPATSAFLSLCREFCFHRVDGRAVIQFALDKLSPKEPAVEPAADAEVKSVHELIEETLVRISDDERRATLLLSYLYVCPGALTRCCKKPFCFNCKRSGHHDTCDTEKIVVDKSLLQCRGCRVMIVKVEGCDSVTCMCGYGMTWSRELGIQSLDRRGLVGVDIFDRELFVKYEQWRQKLRGWTVIITKKMQEREKRVAVNEWLVKHAPKLRRGFGHKIWRFKARRNHTKLQSELFWRAYDNSHPLEARVAVDEALAELFAIDVVE